MEARADVIDAERAVREPAAVFESPEAVVACEELSTGEKVRVLVQWSVDARELRGTPDSDDRERPRDLLERIDAALAGLDESEWRSHEAPPQRQ